MTPEWFCAPRGAVKARAQRSGAKTLGPGKVLGVPELVLCIQMLLHAIAAEDRPALEDFLVPCFPSRIVGPEREPWINHHGQVCVVRKADGDAGKVGGGAEHNFLDRQSPHLRELYQAGI